MAIYEIGSGIYDAYNAFKTVRDPNASGWEKAATVALAAGGLFLPGGGYSAGGRLAAGSLKRFTGDEAVRHFRDHGGELMQALGRKSYNLCDYLDDANHVIQSGTYVQELNGYVKLIGGPGRSAKYAFVGLKNGGDNTSTFHIKKASELARKAPSLGIQP